MANRVLLPAALVLIAAMTASTAAALPITMTPDPHHPGPNDVLSNVTLLSGDTDTLTLVFRWTRVSSEQVPLGNMDMEWSFPIGSGVTGSFSVVSGSVSAFMLDGGGGVAFLGGCADPVCVVDVTAVLPSLPGTSWTGRLSNPGQFPQTTVTYNVVPEPSTALLLGAGLVAFFRRRGRGGAALDAAR